MMDNATHMIAERNQTMNERDEANAAEESPPAGPLKFAYATGSRPLDGYTIKRGVGRGGFGEVYYGTSDGGKQVALKLIRRNLDVELRGVRQCLNLKHPNLVELYDIRQDAADDSWVVMEYVAGDCLEDVLATHPDGLSPDEALAWFRGLAAGVAYLHDHGIVHRDLKPGNIFREQDIVKIGDYGLSKFISASRRSGQTESVGTVHYMAPEIGHGRYGKEIDIYALGIMLYELFTGRVPFDGESVGEVLMKHLTAEPDLTPLAEPYRTVVARALAKDPAKRIGSVGEMLAALSNNASSAASPHVATEQAAGSAQAAAAGVNPHAAVDSKPQRRQRRDPVASAYHNARRGAGSFWSSLTPVTKVAAIALIAFFVMETRIAWVALLPLVIAFLCGYFAWRLVRPADYDEPLPVATLVNEKNAPPNREANDRAAGSPSGTRPTESPQRKRHRGRYRWRDKAVDALPHRTPRERITELTGSLLLSALIAPLVGAFILLIMAGHAGIAGPGPEQFVWLALCGTAGAWAVILSMPDWSMYSA